MNALILLLAGLVCAQAAPQFVFVLPPEFLKQMQKPVGEFSQSGQQPRIPVFPLESLLGSASTPTEIVVPAPVVPAPVVSAPVVPETLQEIIPFSEPTPVAEEEQQLAVESTPVVAAVMSTTNVVAETASETVNEKTVAEQAVPVEVTMVEEAVAIIEEVPLEKTLAESAAPVEVTMVEEAVAIVEEARTEATMAEKAAPIVQEVPIEAVKMETIIPVVQEPSASTPVQEITTDPTIILHTTEPANMRFQEPVTSLVEIVTPAIVKKVTDKLAAVEEVLIVENVTSKTAQEVVIVEEVIPITNIATTQGPVDVPAVSVSSIKEQSFSSPTNDVVDPRQNVDPRFLNYIYVNDAPDVVAAKVALFNLQAASLPKLPVQQPSLI